MNMEGTKHEKAILVALAYIVGFTSGFIAFGMSQPDAHIVEEVALMNTIPVSNADTHPNLPADTLATVDTPQQDDTESVVTEKGTRVYYQNDRLYVSVDGAVNLLSVAKNSLSSAVAAAFSTQGTHISIPKYLASPDGKYVFFCEQQQETDSCIGFVYDVTGTVIQYVAHDGKKVAITADVAKSAAWSENTLSFGTYRSQSIEKPWIVTAQ